MAEEQNPLSHIVRLTPIQRDICARTMSSTAFFYVVLDALNRGDRLAVVRLADGEKALYNHSAVAVDPGEILLPFRGFSADWLKRYGCEGIPKRTLASRILSAADQCDYFAPSLSGLIHSSYNLYGMFPRSQYVDNFFPNLWTEEQKIELFRSAGRVLFINASRSLADAMQRRAMVYHGVKVEYLPLMDWRDADGVIKQANAIDAPLMLLSAGPASKFIGPRLNGVTLDIGQAACRWTFQVEFERRKKLAADAGKLEEYTRSPYQFQL